MYNMHILKFYLTYLYTEYISAILHMFPKFFLLRLNDFDIKVSSNVY